MDNIAKFEQVSMKFVATMMHMVIVHATTEWCCSAHSAMCDQKISSFEDNFTRCCRDVGSGAASVEAGIAFLQEGITLMEKIATELETGLDDHAQELFVQNVPHGGNA